MHAGMHLLQRDNLAKHPGTGEYSEFLFNDNFIVLRNPADRSHRASGKHAAALSPVHAYSSV